MARLHLAGTLTSGACLLSTFNLSGDNQSANQCGWNHDTRKLYKIYQSLITLALIGPCCLLWGLQGNRIKFSRDAIHNSIINPRESGPGLSRFVRFWTNGFTLSSSFLSSNPIPDVDEKKGWGRGEEENIEDCRLKPIDRKIGVNISIARSTPLRGLTRPGEL